MKEYTDGLIRLFLLAMLILVVIYFICSCGTKIPASMNYGTIVDVYKDNYGSVIFRAKKDTAEYNTWMTVYFPMGIQRKDDVTIVPVKYLDSLIKETQIKRVIKE